MLLSLCHIYLSCIITSCSPFTIQLSFTVCTFSRTSLITALFSRTFTHPIILPTILSPGWLEYHVRWSIPSSILALFPFPLSTHRLSFHLLSLYPSALYTPPPCLLPSFIPFRRCCCCYFVFRERKCTW